MAEETTNVQATTETAAEQQQNSTPSVDYDKIEAMINKGTQQKESAILKSYFEQQGMSEDEIKTAVSEYKTKKATAAQSQTETLNTLQSENEKLKQQITADRIHSKAVSVALDMGCDKNSVPYILKMADMAKALDEKGEVSEDAVKNAIEQVLTDVPALKPTNAQAKGFVQVGAQTTTTEADQTAELRKMFGVKK